MVEGVEPVVVGDEDVGAPLEEKREHVVTLLGDGVVERGVALGVLKQKGNQGKNTFKGALTIKSINNNLCFFTPGIIPFKNSMKLMI